MNLFINRESELAFLNGRHKELPQLIIIYGRRRIGKTELIKKFISDKPHIYFLATETSTQNHLNKFMRIVASYFNDFLPKIDSWEEAFKYINAKIKNKKIIIAIDEFPYLMSSNPEIPSLFQLFYDEYLKKNKVFLILSGSSIRMMEEGTLNYKAPLYGRRTGQIKLAPMQFKDSMKFYPELEIGKVMEFYTVVGNIPLYLQEFDQKKDIFGNIKDKILTKKELLNEEVDFLLKQELREIKTYQDILEAIALGKTKAVDIANKSNIELHNLSKYLRVLLQLEFITKQTKATIKKEGKMIRYAIKDNFLDFWYKFIFTHTSLMVENPDALIENIIKPDFNSYVGKKFEAVCMEFLWELNRQQKLNFVFTTLGKEWGKFKKETIIGTYEIDMVALNEKTKEIMFAECKWQNNVNAEKILTELKEKASYVQWHNKTRKEFYCIIAKGFEKKIKDCLCFDIKDMDRIFRNK